MHFFIWAVSDSVAIREARDAAQHNSAVINEMEKEQERIHRKVERTDENIKEIKYHKQYKKR